MQDVRRLFFSRDGGVRAPWRVLGFLALVAATGLVLQPLAAALLPAVGRTTPGGPWGEALQSVVQVLVLLVATGLAIRFLDGGRGWRRVWLGRDAVALRPVAAGAALGAAAIAIPCLLLGVAGWFRIVAQPDGSSWVVFARAAALLLPAALLEELLMRGYLLAVLREALGAVAALALTSVAFGLLHWYNPGATFRSLALVTLAGFFLGGIVLVFRSLYAAWAAHFAWNFVMAALLHAPVSGIALGTPDYRLADTGPDWATGGPWGPEGGAGAMLGMLGGMTYLFARRQRRGE